MVWHKGTVRKKQIIESLEVHKYLERWMIQQLHFKFKYGRDKCQKVLTKMTKDKLVNRFQLDSRDQYIYHLGQRSNKWHHWLMINHFHFQLLRQLKSWHRITYWKPEFDYGYGIADGFYIIENTINGGGVKFFFEAVDNNNPFDRHEENYIKSFHSDWQSQWWADPKKRGVISYPKIICMSERSLAIKTQELEFRVCSLADVQKDVLGVIF